MSEKNAGNPLRGATIQLTLEEEKDYLLSDSVMLELLITNGGEDEIRLLNTDIVSTYRIIAFNDAGVPVPKSKALIAAEASTEAPGVISRSLAILKPGETKVQAFRLEELVELSAPGIYWIVVARRLMSWDEGFLISNGVKLIVR